MTGRLTLYTLTQVLVTVALCMGAHVGVCHVCWLSVRHATIFLSCSGKIFQKMSSTHHQEPIDWVALRSKLPPIDKSLESKASRAKVFKQFDPNGNGYVA